MSAQFTPGPWKVADTYTVGWPVKAGGHIVALAQYLGGTDPAKANAHLIAAAPEMYEALEAARFYVNECRFGGALTEKGHSECAEVLANLDAALAKARGEQ